MSTKTNIAWTDVVDNIIVAEDGGWWCRKISPGCANCYAAKLNQNAFYGGNKLQYSGDPPKLKFRADICDGWARQTKPKRHFVASMTDVFGEWVLNEWIVYMLGAMVRAPKQTFLVLTKRPDIAAAAIASFLKLGNEQQLPRNILIGTSVENQKCADERVPQLLRIRAQVRFLSVEPLLGPIDLESVGPNSRTKHLYGQSQGCNGKFVCNALTGEAPYYRESDGEPCVHYGEAVDWVIVGGESGDRARPCHVEWIRSVKSQCDGAGVPCFIKQLGSRPICDRPKSMGYCRVPLRHPKGGDPNEWPEDLRVRQFPQL